MKNEMIHGYVLTRLLGIGTFGEVWEAKAPGGFRAAVKLIRKRGSQAEARLELNALEALKNLDHLHLLKTFACWDDPEQVVIAMELANGTLRQRLTYCRQNMGLMGIFPDELLHYVREAAEALDYLHFQRPPKFHRDIKPDNILLFTNSNPPHVKLGDCGLLREQCEQGEVVMQMSTAGTPPYIAPEVWSRKTLPQSDQYSLAITYVELRLGIRPIEADSPQAMAAAHTFYVPKLDGLDEQEKQVIARALAKEPMERYGSCVEMVDELERAMGLFGQRFRLGGPLELAQSPLASQIVEDKPPRLTQMRTDAPLPTLHDTNDLDDSPQASKRPADSRTDPDMLLAGASWKGPSTRSEGGMGRLALILGAVVMGLGVLAAASWGIWLLVHNLDGGAHSKKDDTDKKDDKDDKIKKDDKDGKVPITPVKVALRTTAPCWLAAGGECQVKFSVDPRDKAGQLDVSAIESPPGLVFRAEVQEGGVTLTVRAAADVEPGTRDVRLRITRKSADVEVTLAPGTDTIEIQLLPTGFEPDPNSVKGSPPRYASIARTINNQTVEFRLVRRQGAPFYLMENKVWNSLYELFARQKPQAVEGSLWKLGGVANGKNVGIENSPRLPVMRVRRDEAVAFAAWLGGKLPTAAQLDLAAGLDEDGSEARGKSAAVDRRNVGPRSVLEGSDVSPDKIRDLLGNGCEWTRDDLTSDDGKTLAVLRGRSYTARGPLTSALLKEQKEPRFTPTRYPDKASPYTGFRVVIEVPPR